MNNDKARQASVEITPAMIEAGAQELLRFIGDAPTIYSAEEIATKVFVAMSSAPARRRIIFKDAAEAARRRKAGEQS